MNFLRSAPIIIAAAATSAAVYLGYEVYKAFTSEEKEEEDNWKPSIIPPEFHKINHDGLLLMQAKMIKKKNLALQRQLLESKKKDEALQIQLLERQVELLELEGKLLKKKKEEVLRRRLLAKPAMRQRQD